MMINTLLLDRDGVLIPRRQYDYRPEHMTLLPGVLDGLHRFSTKGVRFFIITNQSGVGRGLCTIADVEACHATLSSQLADAGIILTDILCCFHAPKDHCACRKPAIGMWLDLHRRYGLLPETTIMIGDRPSDIAFGRAIGCRTAVIQPSITEELPEAPDFSVQDLGELADQLFKTDA